MHGAVHVEGPSDPAIARVAAAQHGVVTRAQLEAAGLGRGAIAHRVAQRRLHRVHRGVYLVGHPVPPPLAREVAALFSCGDGAVLSHRTAAWLWQVAAAPPADVDVSVAGRDPGRRTGVAVHRVRRLPPDEVQRQCGLPVTSPARTLLDLAEVVARRELERAVREAEVLGLARHDELVALLERSPGRRGAAPLGALVHLDQGRPTTRSEAEDRLLALLRRARLPPTDVNVRVGRHEVDLLWRPQRLVVEVDGYAFHGMRAAFERDRLRDAELSAAGYRVLRVTWRQLCNEPEALIARLAQALARSS